VVEGLLALEFMLLLLMARCERTMRLDVRRRTSLPCVIRTSKIDVERNQSKAIERYSYAASLTLIRSLDAIARHEGDDGGHLHINVIMNSRPHTALASLSLSLLMRNHMHPIARYQHAASSRDTSNTTSNPYLFSPPHSPKNSLISLVSIATVKSFCPPFAHTNLLT
jgi:hypothetical protein